VTGKRPRLPSPARRIVTSPAAPVKQRNGDFFFAGNRVGAAHGRLVTPFLQGFQHYFLHFRAAEKDLDVLQAAVFLGLIACSDQSIGSVFSGGRDGRAADRKESVQQSSHRIDSTAPPAP